MPLRMRGLWEVIVVSRSSSRAAGACLASAVPGRLLRCARRQLALSTHSGVGCCGRLNGLRRQLWANPRPGIYVPMSGLVCLSTMVYGAAAQMALRALPASLVARQPDGWRAAGQSASRRQRWCVAMVQRPPSPARRAMRS